MTPVEFLKADVAARFGMDKVSWKDRLTWFENNKDNLHNLVHKAKEPALYYAAICAWEDHLNGVPSGYGIQFDCTASGIQLLSIMTHDLSAANACNVVGDEIEDAYLVVYNKMQEILGESNPIDRDDVKTAVMTGFYGSEAEPRKLFGEETAEIAAFYEAMEFVAPRCWALNNMLLEYQKTNTDDYSYDWVMPDNFYVHCKVMEVVAENVECLGSVREVKYRVNRPHERNRSLGANLTHSVEAYVVRECIRRTTMSIELRMRISMVLAGHHIDTVQGNAYMVSLLWLRYKQSGMLSARIFDYLDSETITLVDRSTIIRLYRSIQRSYAIRPVHDCFALLPNYASEFLQLFRTVYAELAESDMLKYILEQVTGDTVQTFPKEANFSDMIMQSKYVLA